MSKRGDGLKFVSRRNKFWFLELFLAGGPKSPAYSSLSCPGRGASAVVTNVGTGCGGRGCAVARFLRVDERCSSRTAKSCGPDAPMLAFKLAMVLRITLVTVTTKPGHRGEHEGNRKTIAQGMSDCLR